MDFRTVNLAMNLSGRPLDLNAECNPGGSTICWTPTKGCGSGGMTCVTTSTKLEMMEVTVSLPPDAIEELQRELSAVVAKFASR